jgi:hypothetical protein
LTGADLRHACLRGVLLTIEQQRYAMLR